MGASKCKLSPASFLHDELPALKFSALLMENGTEQFELVRTKSWSVSHSNWMNQPVR